MIKPMFRYIFSVVICVFCCSEMQIGHLLILRNELLGHFSQST